MGVMKYFRHILMDHEIFFKIFDGPQNIFLCSIFYVFLCSNFIFYFNGVGVQNIQTSHQEDLRKTRHVK